MNDEGDDGEGDLDLERCVAAVRERPGDIEAYAQLLRAAVRARDHELVVAVSSALLTLDIEVPHLLELRHRALGKLGRHDEQLADLDRLVALEETSERLTARAEAHLAAERIAQALADLGRAVALDAGPKALRLRAKVLGKNGRLAEARADLVRAAELGGEPLAIETGWLELTGAALASHDAALALEVLGDAIATAPSAVLHLARAKLYWGVGDQERAQVDLDAAGVLDPTILERFEAEQDAEDDRAFAQRMRSVEMTPEAVGAIMRARDRADPDDPAAWYDALAAEAIPGLAGHWLRGLAAFDAERYALAERELAQALALSPDNGDVGESYASVLIRLGDTVDDAQVAADCYRDAVARIDALAAVPWVTYDSRLLRAIALGRLEDPGALAALDALVDDSPSEPAAWMLRGDLRRDSDPARARADFEAAAALGSNEAAAELARLAEDLG
ncbi:MAG: hypothetical protein U1F43_04205 [Myxococcota bacterium]